MHAELERVRGRVSVLRVFAPGTAFPDPYVLALVVAERRWWWPWRRTATLLALAAEDRMTVPVARAIDVALWQAGFQWGAWQRWHGGVKRERWFSVKGARG